MKRKPQNSAAFFENNSWYHRTKILQDDGSIKYSKKGGFATSEEADKSYRRHEDEFKKAYRAYHLAHQINTEVTLKDYLIYWFEEIFSQRIETTTRMVGAYAVYDLILPNIEYDIKVRFANAEYLDALLERVAKVSASAGNKGREILNMAMKEAVIGGYIKTNPVTGTKPYKRQKPKITILSKEKIKVLLKASSENNWYLEILLGLFCGLRKGDDDDKIRLNQRKPSKYKGLRRFGPEKNLQRINKFMKERPIFYKNLIQMKENIRFYLRCFYCITKVMILQFNSENRTELARNG
ncbi:hypothetical protein AAAV70_17535 [Hungatella hathewayi]|uniref:hypothetical protein n=1 Tax=Hungatella hathewayi TaxID=154046 RepID=UPI0032C0B5A1